MAIKNKIKIAIIGVPTDTHLRRRLNKIDYNAYDVSVISPIHIDNYIDPRFNLFSVNLKDFRRLKYFQLYFRYARFMIRENFDVIYCFGALSPLSWVAGIVAKKYLAVSTLGADVYLDEQQPMSPINKLNVKRLIQNADIVTALSSSMKERLLKDFRVPRTRLAIDFYDIEEEWYSPKSKTSVAMAKLPPRNTPIIFSPRMLQPLYQQIEIIKSLPTLIKRYPRLLFVQSGFGTNLSYLKQARELIKNLGLENNTLILKEEKLSQDLINIYDRCDIVIMVPKSDGMPSSMIEGWARKKPIIVSDIEHYDSSANKKLFLKTEVSPRAIAASISKILENSRLRSKLVNESYRYLEMQRKLGLKMDVFANTSYFKTKRLLTRLINLGLFISFIIEPRFKLRRK